MATYSPDQLGIKAPAGGFQQGGWYNGRQYWGGTLSDPGVIHQSSNQQGAGQLVSQEVNAQSAAAQGKTPQEIEDYLASQRRQQAAIKPVSSVPRGYTGTAPSALNMSAGSGGGIGAGAMGATPTLNLPGLYDKFYAESGISDLQNQLSTQEKQFIEAKGKINDNPFLSEATRVGRVAKMEQLYNERTANMRNDMAMKKADIDTKIQLETKQFDINSQQAKDALNQFNTLLSMGVLEGASGEDIANITRMTGLSSGAIQSAINATQQTKADTQVITSTSDSGEVTVSVIDKQTGEIINQNSLGLVGNAQQSRAPSATETKTDYVNMFKQDVGSGLTLTNALKLYGGILDPNDIYTLYNANSMFGPAKESAEELAKYGIKPISTGL